MSSRNPSCLDLEARASFYLDGRLDQVEQQAVQDHLRTCPDCVRQVRGLQRLSKAAREVSSVEVSSDLALRVRKELHRRRRAMLAELGRSAPAAAAPGEMVNRHWRATRHLSSWGWLAAAALLLLSSLATLRIGYVLGAADSMGTVAAVDDPEAATGEVALHPVGEPVDRRTMPAQIAAIDPFSARPDQAAPAEEDVQWAAYQQYGFSAEPFSRAVHALLGDMTAIESVGEPMRRPLLAAEIDYFDLAENAERFLAVQERLPATAHGDSLRRAALLVRDLAQSVEHEPEVDFVAFRDRARASAMSVVAPPPENPTRHPPVNAWQVVHNMEHSLPTREDSSQLVQLLRLRDSWVYGRYEEPIEHAFVISRHAGEGRELMVLRSPMEFTLALTLHEVGLEPIAVQFQDRLDEEVQRMFLRTMKSPRRMRIQRLLPIDLHKRSEAELRGIAYELFNGLQAEPNGFFEVNVGGLLLRQRSTIQENGTGVLYLEVFEQGNAEVPAISNHANENPPAADDDGH